MSSSFPTSAADLLTQLSQIVSLRDAALGEARPKPNRAKRRRRPGRSPLPNGDNGDSPLANGENGECQDQSPLANGENGDCQDQSPLANGENGDGHEQSPSPNGDNGDSARSQAGKPDLREKRGRDSRGRFAKGNLGGPGNPFARRIAALRTVLCSVVTEKDMRELAYQLLAQAQLGDLAATKLLLAYAIGRPTDAVDPDALDANELQLWRQSAVVMDDFHKTLASMPAEIGVPLVRIAALAVGRALAGKMADKLKENPRPARKDQR